MQMYGKVEKIEIIHDPDQRNQELEKLIGCKDQTPFVHALNRALSKWRGAMNPNYPKISKGIDFWSEVSVALRELLKPYGFVKKSEHNIELTVNEETGVAIYPCRGSELTGLSGDQIYPESLRKRGPFTLEYFGLPEINHPNLELFPIENIITPIGKNIWFLLFYIEESNNQVRMRAELSLASSHWKKFVNGYRKRIIFDLSNPDTIIEKSYETIFSNDVDFDLSEKEA